MPAEADLLTAIEREPGDDLAWLALADCLEENGAADRAELVRLREWLRFAEGDDPERLEKEVRLAELLLAGVKPSVPRKTFDLGHRVSLAVNLIPAGRFRMGSPEASIANDERPSHPVTITQPFFLGITSVTQAQWFALIDDKPPGGPNPTYPLQSVLWADANKFCKALSKRIGRGVRLPTEAEWEYACRAGTTGITYVGGHDTINKVAWSTDNSRGHTHRVAGKKPNAWGLHDMLGNVWDWCSDGERDYLARAEVDPKGPNGPRRIVKGGAWRSSSGRCTCSARFAEDTKRPTDDQGFRIVLEWA